MLVDGVRIADVPAKGAREQAIASFIGFIERRLGVSVLFDRRRVPFGRIDLKDPLALAAELADRHIIDWYGPSWSLPDEPPIRVWSCRITDQAHNYSGGASHADDTSALWAALAEAVERYIWFTQTDYFIRPMLATSKQLAARFPHLAPERFAAFTSEQRESAPELALHSDSTFLWILGESLVSGKKTYVPAQQVSAAHRPGAASPREPLIRTQITNGLATWRTESGARLRGALECLEREAYMILWFNQLTLPRAKLSTLRKRSETLHELVSSCERYGLRVHIIPMLTDAPAHAVCAVLEDGSPVGPRFAFGLKAGSSLPKAAAGAILEALRARQFTRNDKEKKHFDRTKPVDDIGHRGRVYYWWMPEHAPHLEFFTKGPEKEFPEAIWEGDTPEEHLARIIAWCAAKKYECVAVPLSHSKGNPTQWHIEMTIMPEIQWTHVTEKYRHLGGERLKSVPRQFGYSPRETPFIEMPHPYC